nr:RsmD family RNA methyltransferase [Planctomycetota bacterium]
MSGKRSSRSSKPSSDAERRVAEKPLRIIGGNFRGRHLLYSGDLRTRPMKDRVREAVFNLLGRAVRDTHAIDMFAGTGALGLEAVSRGAVSATFIEQHFPTARIIEQNAAALQVTPQTSVVAASVFAWVCRQPWQGLPAQPWTVFCSPPYDFYVERQEEMLSLIRTVHEHSPPQSWFVVEADGRFDFQLLAPLGEWDVRNYPPSAVGIHRRE